MKRLVIGAVIVAAALCVAANVARADHRYRRHYGHHGGGWSVSLGIGGYGGYGYGGYGHGYGGYGYGLYYAPRYHSYSSYPSYGGYYSYPQYSYRSYYPSYGYSYYGGCW